MKLVAGVLVMLSMNIAKADAPVRLSAHIFGQYFACSNRGEDRPGATCGFSSAAQLDRVRVRVQIAMADWRDDLWLQREPKSERSRRVSARRAAARRNPPTHLDPAPLLEERNGKRLAELGLTEESLRALAAEQPPLAPDEREALRILIQRAFPSQSGAR
jgi:hypothetical protein